jgi:hypothetical protein
MVVNRKRPRLINPEAWPDYSGRFADILGFRPAALGNVI